jgi:hypothetical protein
MFLNIIIDILNFLNYISHFFISIIHLLIIQIMCIFAINFLSFMNILYRCFFFFELIISRILFLDFKFFINRTDEIHLFIADLYP